MRIGLILCYSAVYPSNKIPLIKDLIKDVPTKFTLDYLSFINSRLHLRPFAEDTQKEILDMLLQRQSRQFKNEILFALAKQKANGYSFHIFDTYTIMRIINVSIEERNNITRPDSTPEDEKAILLAIITSNEKLNDDFKQKIKETDDLLENFCRITWPNVTSSVNHRIRTNFITTLYKCATFLEYVQSNSKIIEHFKKYFGIDAKEDLMKFGREILNMYVVSGMNKVSKKFNHRMNFPLDERSKIISNYCMDLNNFDLNLMVSKDFKTLRTFPIIKLESERFIVTNWNFLLEKMSLGLIFDLFSNTELKNEYLNKNGEPSFNTYKSEIGFFYSEKLFQKVMIDAIVKKENSYAEGDPNNTNNADFYLRKGNSIALIEFKDYLMVKYNTYEEIEADLKGKFTGGKGTGQLKKLIDKLKADITVYEKDISKKINPNRIVIYPIIIVSESLFTIPGITEYLNREFKKILKDEKYPFFVKPLVLIDFDFLLETYDKFKSGKLDFFNCLEIYYKKKRNSKRKARTSNDFSIRVKQFNGFREHLGNFIPGIPSKANLLKPGKLSYIAVKKLGVPKQ